MSVVIWGTSMGDLVSSSSESRGGGDGWVRWESKLPPWEKKVHNNLGCHHAWFYRRVLLLITTLCVHLGRGISRQRRDLLGSFPTEEASKSYKRIKNDNLLATCVGFPWVLPCSIFFIIGSSSPSSSLLLFHPNIIVIHVQKRRKNPLRVW